MRDATYEQELVERLRARDESAVTELANRYGSRIFQLALRYMKNREDAEEVAQDVLLKVYHKVDAFRGDAALSSWIYRITFNTAMSRLRTTRAMRMAEVDDVVATSDEGSATDQPRRREPADWSDLADERVLRKQMRDTLLSAVAELPDIYREPVKPELIAQRIKEIKAQGVVAAGSLTPQRVTDYVDVALDAGLDILVIQGTVVSA
ncbi:MAG: RNA polymerase sigma factor, partial [Vicinamibacteria bacterium]